MCIVKQRPEQAGDCVLVVQENPTQSNYTQDMWKTVFLHDCYSAFWERLSSERQSDCACQGWFTVKCAIPNVTVTIYRFSEH